MHVVRRFPPSDAEAAAEVCNERTDQCVVHEVAGDTAVASVVRCEHDLLLVILSVMARLQFSRMHTQKKPRKMAEVMYH